MEINRLSYNLRVLCKNFAFSNKKSEYKVESTNFGKTKFLYYMKTRITLLAAIFFATVFTLSFYQCQSTKKAPIYPEEYLEVTPERAVELAEQIRQEVAVSLVDDLELSLWASDSLVTDPIAISIDDKGGIYYTRGRRLENTEFDIRGYREWMTASISFQSVEDRRNFLRETLAPSKSEENKKRVKDNNGDGSHDWRDLLVEKESVWYVTDESDDGFADKAQMYIEDFHTEVSDLANGVLYHDDEVYIACAPDLWRCKDEDGDGIADSKTSISHGYQVHIGFGAHGMSGITVGPDGRIWWGIGDIGMNVVDKDGKRWKYPNQGVIVRCEPDGSDFEVFAAGLRNTHEFVFDQYGNLITEDNDGDHQGERERLVYVTYGSDGGWRINWQFGKYTDPKNNSYKVWMDEKLHVPRWDGQAAYITPPIINYVNGPTGMAYNPGTALDERWKDYFFIAEFRGSPANSPIHAFKLRSDGASFALDTTVEVVKGVLPTGIRFGPDGAMYFGDWIDGWGAKYAGRIWKVDSPSGKGSPIRKEVQALMASDFSAKKLDELKTLLAHVDMRIRQKSQFELAKRGVEGLEVLKEVAQAGNDQLARIHALWGIGQFARKDMSYAENFLQYLNDTDAEIQAQAAKLIGDVRYGEASEQLIALLQHPSLRVQFFAAEALGRTAEKSAFQAVLDMLIANDDKDAWLRHAGVLALSKMDNAQGLAALSTHQSRAARIAAVVALRRMKDSAITEFLNDKDEYIVTEAARAIHDDFSIPDAMPALANLLLETSFGNEALVRRAINANLRLGTESHLQNVLTYAQRRDAPEILRAEAVATLSTWAEPSPHDRVDGRIRQFEARDRTTTAKIVAPAMASLLKDKSASVQAEAAKGANYLQVKSAVPALLDLIKSSKDVEVRKQSLLALSGLKAAQLGDALQMALNDKDASVRAQALEILPTSDLDTEKTKGLFITMLNNGSMQEKQAVFTALGTTGGAVASDLLKAQFTALETGKVEPEIQLDIIEAIEMHSDTALHQRLAAYQAAKPKDDEIALYREALYGGNPDNGRSIFYWNEAAQCGRCHRIWEWGGDAGPGLADVANRLTKEQLLLSMVNPSAEYAKGYEVVTLEMQDEEIYAGVVEEENEEEIRIKIGKNESRTFKKTDIIEQTSVPSAMFTMTDKLSKKEIRDVLAFLGTLHGEES